MGRVVLTRLWDGSYADAVGPAVTLRMGASELEIDVDAPYFGDPAPPGPVGSTPGLFNYEVVEVFLLGSGDRYLEVELSPHGHYWVLGLEGRRQVAWQGRALSYSARLHPEHAGAPRWRGQARVPTEWLPEGLSRFNIAAIDGVGAARRYWAHAPSGGVQPDFHALESFAPLGDLLG